ncbi:MAG: hypothetical protein O3C23_02015 [bacterium]|nr:hypothetical protein [bacterium]
MRKITRFQVAESALVAYGEDLEGEFSQEREQIKAYLVTELLDQLKYPMGAIQVNQLVGIKEHGFLLADVMAENRRYQPFLLCKVEVLNRYYERKGLALQDLYAQALGMNSKNSLQWLAYYTRWYEQGNVKKRYVVIDYLSFPTLALWQEAGSLARSSLPSYPRV